MHRTAMTKKRGNQNRSAFYISSGREGRITVQTKRVPKQAGVSEGSHKHVLRCKVRRAMCHLIEQCFMHLLPEREGAQPDENRGGRALLHQLLMQKIAATEVPQQGYQAFKPVFRLRRFRSRIRVGNLLQSWKKRQCRKHGIRGE